MELPPWQQQSFFSFLNTSEMNSVPQQQQAPVEVRYPEGEQEALVPAGHLEGDRPFKGIITTIQISLPPQHGVGDPTIIYIYVNSKHLASGMAGQRMREILNSPIGIHALTLMPARAAEVIQHLLNGALDAGCLPQQCLDPNPPDCNPPNYTQKNDENSPPAKKRKASGSKVVEDDDPSLPEGDMPPVCQTPAPGNLLQEPSQQQIFQQRIPGDDKWFYADSMGGIQGPFFSHDMAAWYMAGYLPPWLLIRRECDNRFAELGYLTTLVYGRVPFQPGPPVPPLKA